MVIRTNAPPEDLGGGFSLPPGALGGGGGVDGPTGGENTPWRLHNVERHENEWVLATQSVLAVIAGEGVFVPDFGIADGSIIAAEIAAAEARTCLP